MLTKQFPITAVLSTYTGRLCGDMDDIYELLTFVLEDSIMTHQLPAAAEAIKPMLEREFPWLLEVSLPEDISGFRTALEDLQDQHDFELTVPQFPEAIWTRDNALADLVKLVGADKRITIVSRTHKD